MSPQNEEKETKDSVYADVIIEGHSYDGITEYDNPMPSWWLMIFYATIAWSVFYVVGISVGFINTYDDDLRVAQRAHEEVRQAHAQLAPTVDDAMIRALVGDEEALTRGRNAYMGSCAACHGQSGEGGIGPSLSADVWVHGGSLEEIYATIYDGVPAKGMPSWGPILTQDDLLATVVYVDSLRGGSAEDDD